MSDFGFSTSAVWRFCSLAALAVNGFVFFQGGSQSVGAKIPLRDRSAYFVFWPTEAICQLALIAVVFNFFPDSGGSLYLVFLYSALIQTAWIFLEFLDSVFDPGG